jgi:ABC-type transporter Mla subunit MlaD
VVVRTFLANLGASPLGAELSRLLDLAGTAHRDAATSDEDRAETARLVGALDRTHVQLRAVADVVETLARRLARHDADAEAAP